MDGALVEFSGKVTGNPVFPTEADGTPVEATLMLTLEGADEDAVESRMEEFVMVHEETEVSLEEGQYIVISDCEMRLVEEEEDG